MADSERMSRFKVGDVVEWTSSSNGRTKAKRGAVAAVVRARGNPVEFARGLPGAAAWLANGPGVWRDHESYLVTVVEQGKRGKRTKLYWPVVALLRPAIVAEASREGA